MLQASGTVSSEREDQAEASPGRESGRPNQSGPGERDARDGQNDRGGGQKLKSTVARLAGGSMGFGQLSGSFWSLWIDKLRDSFWFVPSLMASVAFLGGVFMPYLDAYLLETGKADPLLFLYDAGPSGARSVLTAVASSSITVAATVFSITIATLTLTSSQFGPRLLRTFTSDRGVQFALGTFVSTFLYPLLVLRVVQTGGEGEENTPFVPFVSVLIAMLLAVWATGVLIYFVHHVSHLIRAPSVIEAVGDELDGTLDTCVPADAARGDQDAESGLTNWAVPDQADVLLRAKRSGFVRVVAISQIVEKASELDTVAWVIAVPGQYVYENEPLLVTRHPNRFNDEALEEMGEAFGLGDSRTVPEDPLFGINQLTEIAQRAMSPGINDPFTAITCIDRLGASLSRVAGRPFPDARHRDEEGQTRAVDVTLTWDSLVRQSFNPIRRYGSKDSAVLTRLLMTLEKIAHACPRRDRLAPLREVGDDVLAAGKSSGLDRPDLTALIEAHTRLRRTLAQAFRD